MELRHYISFAIATLLLQLFIFIFNRTLFWLFGEKLNQPMRRAIQGFTFISANLIILLTIFRIYPLFRLSALILVFLLFSAFSSFACILIYRLGKSFISQSILHRTLRGFYPLFLVGLIGLSIYNAYVPTIIHYQIKLDKPMANLRIGMASDLHLGKFFGAAQLDKLADIMQREKVDIILLPGDIMDDDTKAYAAENMQPHLAKLKAPLGVYATLGNHDFFGHQKVIEQEIRRAGIEVLMDRSIVVNNQFVLIGRNDDLVKDRPSTQQLLAQIDTRLPVLLLDHRPTQITEHSTLPVDIQFSGHTHKGQIFPANLITKMLYRLDYGYEKIGNGHFFVTSGYGFWGIPMRLGSQSEVLIIDVQGTTEPPKS